ncbi:hypothetical protein COCMIDRAFT_26359 [Bipolaris oryzae ATCC 44560]|uniref:Uncharacterized protein n=1 Tax=Bipolaris oryzae ATCC 44560 TaxID=930090 RepID=W6Z622_COCMI|nr:uncharacterized protein COCMIDRAFT_26359 [Bipolaris oryzae ATCC 44560]EUC45425.1 hypothetical protein COCMIDRAFT_26359 [Bipolaris oryzae ATCC 44560]
MENPALNRSISTITIVALLHAQSYTYPLTRVSNATTKSPPPPPPTSSPKNPFLPIKLTRRSRIRQYKTFNSSHINIEMSDLNHASSVKPSLSHLTDADYDGDAEDNGAECADVDLVTLALCTVDSMEIIRRDTEEKWKGGRSRSGSASASGNGSVMGGVKKTVTNMGVSVRNGVKGLARKLTF